MNSPQFQLPVDAAETYADIAASGGITPNISALVVQGPTIGPAIPASSLVSSLTYSGGTVPVDTSGPYIDGGSLHATASPSQTITLPNVVGAQGGTQIVIPLGGTTTSNGVGDTFSGASEPVSPLDGLLGGTGLSSPVVLLIIAAAIYFAFSN